VWAAQIPWLRQNMKILFKFILFFALLLGGFLYFDSANASVVYTNVQDGVTNAGVIDVVDLMATTIPVGSISWWFGTSGNFNDSNYHIGIFRDGIEISSTSIVAIDSGRCYPTTCEEVWNFINPVPITYGDEITLVNDPGCSSACSNLGTDNTKYLELNSYTSNPATLTQITPSQGQNFEGMPSHFKLRVSTEDEAFCGKPYVTFFGSSTSVYSATGNGICMTPNSTYDFYAQNNSGYPFQGFVTSSPFMTDISGNNILLTGSVVTFYVVNPSTVFTGPVNENGEPIFTNPNPITAGDVTASSSIWYVDCTAYDNQPFFSSSTLPGIICGFKKASLEVAQKLFEPDPSVLNQYSSLTLVGKFPFAYWYDLKNIYDAQSVTSTNAFPALTLHMPNFSAGSATSTNLAVFSSSSISTYVKADNITLFKTLLTYALYFSFGWYVYNRGRGLFNTTE